MEKHIEIYAYYSQEGHRGYLEDTWEIRRTVDNVNDVFEFHKECHLRDAGNRNDYPVCSFFGGGVSLEYREYVIIDDTKFYSGEGYKDYEDKEGWVKQALDMYKLWDVKLRRVMTKKKEWDKIKEAEERDRKQFERLKQKYNPS